MVVWFSDQIYGLPLIIDCIYQKKSHASDWLKEVHFSCNMSAKLQHECKIQIVQARFKNFVYLDFLSCFLIFITFILKSLVILEIWLALIGAIFLPIAPFFALNCIFLPSQQKNFTKIQQPIACVKKLIKLQENEKRTLQLSPKPAH